MYTNSTAKVCQSDSDEDPTPNKIDIGRVDDASARWWAALLAPDQGWRAIIAQYAGQIYQAPWAVSVSGAWRVCISWQRNTAYGESFSSPTPPSSKQALNMLTEFALQHNLSDQLSSPLAAALLLPTHNYYGAAAQVADPARSDTSPGWQLDPRTPDNWEMIAAELPYYMSVSCNPSLVMSSLCGIFWDSEIPCNQVSPWLHPIIQEIPAATAIAGAEHYHLLFEYICAIHCPQLSALWFGAAMAGLVPLVLDFVRSGTPLLDQNGFPWTGCAHSFMDIISHECYFDLASSGPDIARSDVWQRQHLPLVVEDDLYYESRPFAPWKPPRRSKKSNCDLRVQVHEKCSRHELSYQKWNWKLEDGSVDEDYGYGAKDLHFVRHVYNFETSPPANTEFSNVPLSTTQTASQNASRAIFQWAIINGEGIPQENIYTEPWLEDALNNDNISSLSDWSDKDVSEHKGTAHQDRASLGGKLDTFDAGVTIYDWLTQQ